MIACQILITGLIARVANDSKDPLRFLSDFRDEILAVGGSRSGLESFVAFRGREPRIDALLRHHGMVAVA